MNDQESLIAALKVANKQKDEFICMLIVNKIKKDGEIDKLRDRIEFLEKWMKWNIGKSYLTIEGRKYKRR